MGPDPKKVTFSPVGQAKEWAPYPNNWVFFFFFFFCLEKIMCIAAITPEKELTLQKKDQNEAGLWCKLDWVQPSDPPQGQTFDFQFRGPSLES